MACTIAFASCGGVYTRHSGGGSVMFLARLGADMKTIHERVALLEISCNSLS